jgi:biopolymer transport protein ExbB/TolQ
MTTAMQSDFIFNLTFAVLIAMSALTWTIAIGKVIQLRQARRRALAISQTLASQTDWLDFQALGHNSKAGDAGFLVQHICEICDEYAGVGHSNYTFEQLHAMFAAEVQRKLGVIARHKESWLNALASISSTAPFLGLFGTVWGIMQALVVIGETGAANITVVAAPIGGALTTTAVGIVTAIPAVVFFNIVNRMVRQHIGELENFSEGLLRYVLHYRSRWGEGLA